MYLEQKRNARRSLLIFQENNFRAICLNSVQDNSSYHEEKKNSLKYGFHLFRSTKVAGPLIQGGLGGACLDMPKFLSTFSHAQ